jgi:hypothetical protein
MRKARGKAMSKARPDFATIQLSDAGKRMAGEHGVIHWANGRRHFTFVAGEKQEVERSYEWNHLLRHEVFEGQPILEKVPEEDGELPQALKTLLDAEPGEGD